MRAFVAFLVLATLAGCSDAPLPRRTMHGGDPTDPQSAATPWVPPEEVGIDARASAPVIAWTCSMHPEVRREEPGRCPHCGMPLQRQEGR